MNVLHVRSIFKKKNILRKSADAHHLNCVHLKTSVNVIPYLL